MLRRTCLFLALVLACNLAVAQQAPPAIFWLITVDVPMAHVAEYDATVTEVVGKIRATEEGSAVRFLGSSGPETGYNYAIPMDDLSDYSAMMENFGKAVMAAGVGAAGELGIRSRSSSENGFSAYGGRCRRLPANAYIDRQTSRMNRIPL